jgi:hypothetical protein
MGRLRKGNMVSRLLEASELKLSPVVPVQTQETKSNHIKR